MMTAKPRGTKRTASTSGLTHAGFGAVRCAADAETAGRLSLHFDVSHSSYAVAHERVQWTVHELADAVATVDCVLGDGSQASSSESGARSAAAVCGHILQRTTS